MFFTSYNIVPRLLETVLTGPEVAPLSGVYCITVYCIDSDNRAC